MINFLLLCNRPAKGTNADTITDHIDAIQNMPGVKVCEVSMLGHIPERLDLDRFDAIGIHYSLHISDPRNHFLSERSIERIAAFRGAKYIWMHDEYRRVNETLGKLARMGIGTIFTVIPRETADKVYTREALPDTVVETVLTGYVSQALRDVKSPPLKERELDVVYRARRPPYWLGSFAMEKIDVGLDFRERARQSGLNVDISVEEWDRKYGTDWLAFLGRSKASLSVESGSSIIDFTGEVETAVDAFVATHRNATFEEVRFITDPVDNRLVIKCISPRIFEIAACRSVIIATPGYYSGVIEPWVHYLPLETDLSNFDEITDFIRNNPDGCQTLVDNAYRDLIASDQYSYERFSVYSSSHIAKSETSVDAYGKLRLFVDLHLSPSYLMHNYVAHYFQKYLLRTSLRKYLIATWSRLPVGVQSVLRPMMRAIGR